MATTQVTRRRMVAPADEQADTTVPATEATIGRAWYVLPVVHVRLPDRAVEIAFWGSLAGAAAFGVVDAPLAVLIGGAVLIARHRVRSRA